jgi:hypothetical protein
LEITSCVFLRGLSSNFRKISCSSMSDGRDIAGEETNPKAKNREPASNDLNFTTSLLSDQVFP